jgi:hypothetical protein
MTLGVRDISAEKFFVDETEYGTLRTIRHYGGFQGGELGYLPRYTKTGERMMVPRRDIYEWLLQNVGPRAGQVFKIDRIYWPDQKLKPLPAAWQAVADFWKSEHPRWNIVPTIGYIDDTIIMPDDQAVLFRMIFGGELIEL